MAARNTRAQIARETLDILERGHYSTPTGREVSIRAELASARLRSIHLTPEQFPAVRRQCEAILRDRADRPPVVFEVRNETTLHSARRLIGDDNTRVLALNFASARNPGGGFLKGSQAQEESLARASGLYACINPLQAMYEANRHFSSCLYTDHMIYSPDVPVFRDDNDTLLERPYPVSFVTAPAVNAGAVRRNEPKNLHHLAPVMLARLEKILALAVSHGHEVLVLGAWGCGVFANDPEQVAGWFTQLLTADGPFRAAFQKVAFAVLDRTPGSTTIQPFDDRFGGDRSI